MSDFNARHVCHIDHRHIHAYSSDDRSSPSADQDGPAIRQETIVSIRIAHRQHRDKGWARRNERSIVADTIASLNMVQVCDRCFPRQNRPQFTGERSLCGRLIAIEKKAWPYDGIMTGGMFGNGGAVRRVHQRNREALLLQHVQALLKSRQLCFCMLAILIVGISQMCHDSFQTQRLMKHWTAEEAWQLKAGQAEAAHTRFDFNMYPVGPGSGRHSIGEGLHHIRSKQDRCQSMGHQIRKLPRDRRAHHHDVIVDAGLAEGKTFIDCGDRKMTDGKPLEGARHFEGTVTVGIRLDDGQHI